MNKFRIFHAKLAPIIYPIIIFCLYIIIWNVQAYFWDKNPQIEKSIGIESITDYYFANAVLSGLIGIIILAIILFSIKLFRFLNRKKK